ncbi:unnamed protein product [Miscanthus lutarioriparius]|uniref:Uncharacterized protein n=1 Tax=Miscanthus lutarioriparius TaxID=422564 RepID=A0A811MVN8_9POAL|nr:unnamed protein product [Miscanthus lutarioriparius]
MDPKFKGEWSASKIKMVKSLIAWDNANNNFASDMNKKHNQIVNELQAMLPSKEKHQSGNQHVEASSNLMNQPFGVFVGDLSMGNMEAFDGYQKVEMSSTRNVKETPWRKPTPRKESQHTRRFWTIDEHRQFLRGLHVYGRGNWKNISRHFVTTKTPVQKNASAWEGPTFGRGVYNTNHYCFARHPTSMNNAQAWSPFLYHTGHGSSNNSQMATLAIG